MLSVYNPRQTILVSARGKSVSFGKEEIKDNLITLDWHMPASFEPLLYMIAVGKTRFSRELIDESGVFAVNFIPPEMEKAAVFCGRHSGRHMDKWKESGLEKIESDKIDCSRIGGAAGYLECKVTGRTEAGDHIIYLGQILASESVTSRRLFHLDADRFTTLR